MEALLAFLVLHSQSHAREKLAALLWGETTDARARHSLRTTLTALRSSMGSDLLNSEHDEVQLNPHFPLWCDARELMQAWSVTQGKEFAPDLSLAPLLDLYRGELLADFYDDWVLPLRETYRSVYLDGLLTLAQDERGQSQYTRAVEYARRVIAADPANERAHQHLMFCYLALGDRSAALAQYQTCASALREELGVEPARETTALYQWIQNASTGQTPHAARITNLPLPLTSFVGRTRELVQIKQWLRETRLLTLVGAGGSGKTRLAIQAATDEIDAYPDGVWWVELAPLADTGDAVTGVTQAVAQAVGVQPAQHQSMQDALLQFLQERALLIVLDNCEHLVDACARVTAEILRACPRVRVFATTREGLGITGERIYAVPTLAVPPSAERGGDNWLATLLMEYESVSLFMERARAVRDGLELNVQNAPAVVQICARLDGIPLALELAAARAQAMSIEQIAARLDDRFQLLTRGSRAALPRQQTLRALIDWSYDLLSETERSLFEQLAVFAGGWTLDAVEQVATFDSKNLSVLEPLTRLVEKSLVVFDPSAIPPRYRLLETLREYASEKLVPNAGVGLEAPRQAELAHRRHARYYLAFAEQATALALAQDDLSSWLSLEREQDNLRAALVWSLDNSDSELALQWVSTLGDFWLTRGSAAEGLPLAQRALDASQAHSGSPLYTRALLMTARLADERGEYERAHALYQASLEQRRALGDIAAVVETLSEFSVFSYSRGDRSLARQTALEGLALARNPEHSQRRIGLLTHLGRIEIGADRYPQARAYLQEALELARAQGSKRGIAQVLHNLGIATYSQGQYFPARDYYLESLALSRELGNLRAYRSTLNTLGLVATALAEWDAARAYFEQALEMGQESGERFMVALVTRNLGALAFQQGELGNARSYAHAALRHAEGLGANSAPVRLATQDLAAIALAEGDNDAARTATETVLAQWSEIGDVSGIAATLELLAFCILASGEAHQAQIDLERAFEMWRGMDHEPRLVQSHLWLGAAARARGEWAASAASFETALQVARKLNDTYRAALALRGMAGVFVARGNMVRAAELLGAARADSQHQARARHLPKMVQDQFARDLHAVRDVLGEIEFESAIQ